MGLHKCVAAGRFIRWAGLFQACVHVPPLCPHPPSCPRHTSSPAAEMWRAAPAAEKHKYKLLAAEVSAGRALLPLLAGWLG